MSVLPVQHVGQANFSKCCFEFENDLLIKPDATGRLLVPCNHSVHCDLIHFMIVRSCLTAYLVFAQYIFTLWYEVPFLTCLNSFCLPERTLSSVSFRTQCAGQVSDVGLRACGIELLFCAPDTGGSIQNFVVGLIGNCAVVSHTIMHIGD